VHRQDQRRSEGCRAASWLLDGLVAHCHPVAGSRDLLDLILPQRSAALDGCRDEDFSPAVLRNHIGFLAHDEADAEDLAEFRRIGEGQVGAFTLEAGAVRFEITIVDLEGDFLWLRFIRAGNACKHTCCEQTNQCPEHRAFSWGWTACRLPAPASDSTAAA